MPIDNDKYAFIKANVDISPNVAGVYALYDGDECIYIGRAQGESTTIRSRLQNHLNGREGTCTQKATHYKWEITPLSASREKELLEEFQLFRRGKLPRCNKQVG